jgi:hypothetical protein
MVDLGLKTLLHDKVRFLIALVEPLPLKLGQRVEVELAP